MTAKYVNQFTLGNLLTILGMVLALIVQWNITQTRIVLLENRDSQFELQIAETAAETRRIRPEFENRLRALENRSGQAIAELSNVTEDIREVKDALRDINQELRATLNVLKQNAKP